MLGAISAGVSILGGIKGLFGKKPKERTPRDGILSQAAGAREAADKYGFNPLTLLQAGAGHGFSGGGASAPPLASIQAITEGLKGLDDVASGDAARRRQADQLEIDLAKVRLDQARSGVAPVAIGHSWPQRQAGPLTGRGANSHVGQPNVTSGKPKFQISTAPNVIAPGREIDVQPVLDTPGVYQVNNRLTFGKPVTLPGESLESDLDSLLPAAVIAAPQAARNYVEKVREETEAAKDDTPAEKWERRKDAVRDNVLHHPPGFLGAFSRVTSFFN